jgi:hypothetical protein
VSLVRAIDEYNAAMKVRDKGFGYEKAADILTRKKLENFEAALARKPNGAAAAARSFRNLAKGFKTVSLVAKKLVGALQHGD